MNKRADFGALVVCICRELDCIEPVMATGFVDGDLE